MKTCLITGGAGFIGSNLAKRLVDENWVVSIVDDMSTGELEFIPAGVNEFLQYDFSDDIVLDLIKEKTFNVVFHLAAKPRVGYSVDFPAETTDININRTVKLMSACRGNVDRFINTSSSSVYGGAQILPTVESCVHDPKSPYALQKSVSEQYCKLFASLYGLDTVSVRPFNVFGPNQKGDNPYACAVSAWLYAIKHGKALRSDGTGEQTRDITYVDNVVDIFVRCANYKGRFDGEAFNAGTGTSFSNNEVLDWFERNYPFCQVDNAPARPGDVMHTHASIEKAERILRYKVLVPFWEGVEKTRAWAMTNPIF